MLFAGREVRIPKPEDTVFPYTDRHIYFFLLCGLFGQKKPGKIVVQHLVIFVIAKFVSLSLGQSYYVKEVNNIFANFLV